MTVLQALFTCLICVQFLVVVLHDLVDIPGWNHGSQVKAVVGPTKYWVGTLANGVFPGIAVGYAVYWWGRPASARAETYWLVYCTVTAVSAVAMWWVPYFFGCSEKQRLEYSEMYAGTKHVLPERGENPRPNLLHLCFHTLFAVTLGLSVVLRFGRP